MKTSNINENLDRVILIEDVIYYTDDPNPYIFRANANGKGWKRIICLLTSFNQSYNHDFAWKDSESLRLATYEETRWFEACEKADTFVERSDVSYELNYEIY